MKSQQVALVIPAAERKYYSELQVLQSAAGYYIGTIFNDPKYKFQEPGSRDSCYFPTREAATKALEKLEELVTMKGIDDGILHWETWMINTDQDPFIVGYRYRP